MSVLSQSDVIVIRRADPHGTDWQNVLELVRRLAPIW